MQIFFILNLKYHKNAKNISQNNKLNLDAFNKKYLTTGEKIFHLLKY